MILSGKSYGGKDDNIRMEQESKSIVFKGNNEGLVIVVPEDYDFDKAKTEIEEKVQNAARFFRGAKIKVVYRGITLSPEEEEIIKKILDEKSGAVIESLSKDDESKRKPAVRMPKKTAETSGKMFFWGKDTGMCKFVKSTVRSGTRIEFDGSVIVLGDVNPGGEIIATGNVVVLGALRGMVHAGSEGNRDCFIYALKLKPIQVRIADMIARMPEAGEEAKSHPEIARIKDGIIEVEQL